MSITRQILDTVPFLSEGSRAAAPPSEEPLFPVEELRGAGRLPHALRPLLLRVRPASGRPERWSAPNRIIIELTSV